MSRLLPGGIWGFPVSPFTNEGALDCAELAASVELQVSGGVDAIVVNGALAEVDALNGGEWVDAAVAAGQFTSRVPVLAALPAEESAARAAARALASIPVTAMLVLAPPGGSAAGLVALARAAVEIAGVPAVLYQRGDIRLEAGKLAEAIGEGTVVGVKDGTRDLRALRRLMSAFAGEVTIAAAFEDMTLPYWALGVDALCPASAAHDPSYARAWLRQLQAGNVAAARALLEAFAYPITDLRLSRPGIDVAVVKEVLRLRGRFAGPVRAPGQELTARECTQVAVLVEQLDAQRESW